MRHSAFAADHRVTAAVLVAALGYFVDVYDLVLFSVVRIASLKDIGVPEREVLPQGVLLLNAQLIGMLIGGVMWGMLGDKKGRIQVLFGSILLYSLANIANAFVTSVEQYAVLRFIAGVGLAGEIGAGITLVSELMSKEKRGLGTTIVAAVGVSGAILAGMVSEWVHWRTAYVIGGIMGLLLLLLRVSVHESGMFASMKGEHVTKGNILMLFGRRDRFIRYLNCILLGTPIWFVVGVLVTFCPEIGKALGIVEPLKASQAVIAYSIGITVGDVASGVLSQVLQSRKRAIGWFLMATVAMSALILNVRGGTADMFYLMCIPLGFFIGYWAVLITTSAEQFGINLRATVATTVPNFVRGSTVLMTLMFNSLKEPFGVVGSAQSVGVVVFILAGWSLYSLKETFGKDLAFVEEGGGVRQINGATPMACSSDVAA